MDWQPIETAPKDGTVIWVASDFSMRLAYWHSGADHECRGTIGGGWRDHSKAEHRELAHMDFDAIYWQPLPEPPCRLTPQPPEKA